MKKIIIISLITALAGFVAASANAQSAGGNRGQDRQQEQLAYRNAQGATVETGNQYRKGERQYNGQRKGDRMLNGQRRGLQDGSGRAHGGGLRDGTGPCAVDGVCPR